EDLVQALARDVLHGDPRKAVLGPAGDDRDDPGMPQARERLSFALEAGGGLLRERQTRAEDLERDAAVEATLPRAPDDARAAAPQAPQDPETRDRLEGRLIVLGGSSGGVPAEGSGESAELLLLLGGEAGCGRERRVDVREPAPEDLIQDAVVGR